MKTQTKIIMVLIVVFMTQISNAGEEKSYDFIKLICANVEQALEGSVIKSKLTMIEPSNVSSLFEKNNTSLPQNRQRPVRDNSGFSQTRDLVITTLGGKMDVSHSVHASVKNEPFNYVEFFELGRVITSLNYEKGTDKQIHNLNSTLITDPLGTTNAFTFGRSFLPYWGYQDFSLTSIDGSDGLYKLSINSSDSSETIRYTIDSKKGFCWTEVETLHKNDMKKVGKATNYQRVKGIWFPYKVEIDVLYKGNVIVQQIHEVISIDFLEDPNEESVQLSALKNFKSGDVVVGD